MASGNFTEPQSTLVLLAGLPGSGKTTFATLLAGTYGFQHVESDAVRRTLSAVPSYTPAESAAVFARVEAAARRSLEAGTPVVVDATNLLRSDRRRFFRLAGQLDAQCIPVVLTAPESVIRERLSRPRGGSSQAGPAVYHLMKDRYERSGRPFLLVDSRFPMASSAALVARLAGVAR